MENKIDRTATGFEKFICIIAPWFGILMSIALANSCPTASKECYEFCMIALKIILALAIATAIILPIIIVNL